MKRKLFAAAIIAGAAFATPLPLAAQYAYGTQQVVSSQHFIDPSNFQEGILCQLILDLTNQERARAGLPPVSGNVYLASSATYHSRDMAARRYFAHKSKGILKRSNPWDRARSAGYPSMNVGENIAMIPTINSQRVVRQRGQRGGGQVVDADHNTYERLAVICMDKWMKSSGHRANILSRRYNEMGVGVAVGMRDNIPYVYLTQNFGG